MAKSKTQDPLHTTPRGDEALDEYVIAHSDAEPEYLYRLYRATNIHMLHGRMASGHLQGRMLKMLVEMIRPRNIVEVGTFSGYSALCMAEGLERVHSFEQSSSMNAQFIVHSLEQSLSMNVAKPKVFTFEINDEQEDFTRPWIENSPWADHVRFIIGDAITEVPRLVAEENIIFDMAFLDGDKRTYLETYEMLLPLMPSGAFILADNTLWDGHVIDPDYSRDQQTQGILRFNEHVAKDERVTKVIVPLRDGLTLIRKL